MNKDRIEGKVKDVAGRIERQAGEWTGNAKAQVKGSAKQAEGKLQNTWGKVKDAAGTTETPNDDRRDASADEAEQKQPDFQSRNK